MRHATYMFHHVRHARLDAFGTLRFSGGNSPTAPLASGAPLGSHGTCRLDEEYHGEAARGEDQYMTGGFLDIDKFDGNVSHAVRLREAIGAGFPLDFLRPLLVMDQFDRVIVAKYAHSKPVRVAGTIRQGCSMHAHYNSKGDAPPHFDGYTAQVPAGPSQERGR